MTIETPDWVKDAIFYQIFPDRFARSERVSKPANLDPWGAPPTPHAFQGGDLIGVVEHLDYLVDLGVNAIYFNPIFQSAANHRYHTYDYWQVDPILGGNSAFRELLDAAHDRGIRIVLDGVFNHASRGFFQFNHILENEKQSPYINWFNVKEFPLHAYSKKKKPNYETWFGLWALPKFNTENPEVREFIYDVAEHWIKEGIDGWRLDVPLEIETEGFWEEFRDRVKGIDPEAYILAEIWEEANEWLQGEHFDAVMNYIFNRICYGYFGQGVLDTSLQPGGFKLEQLDVEDFAERVKGMVELYPWPVTLVQYNLLSSHDEPRFLTMMRGDKRRLRLATLFQMTCPGAPSVYYGDEIGMEGGPDPDSRRAFPWDESEWDKELLADFKRFIALRKEHEALRRGGFATLHSKDGVYAFVRQGEAESIVVALNPHEASAEIELDVAEIAPNDASLHDAWSDEVLMPSGGTLKLTIPEMEGRVLIYKKVH